ncbi:MAG: alpha/beta hydrolase [Clostridiales bacterium]|nr:alpha/beta hydrolase [Clostridiales bacterium]
MEWYFILLIVLGGLAVLYLLFCIVIASVLLKAATTPVAHTIDDAREYQAKYEGMQFDDYDEKWSKQAFELDGVSGKIRGEIIFNPAMSPRNKVAIICHGHTWNRINSLKYAYLFYNKGYNVIIYDHAYFGLSDGEFTTLGLNEKLDLSAVIDLARETFGKDAIVALHGESMGAATVLCELGIRSDIDFVVADCPFSNTMKYYRELCTHLTHLPGFPIVDFANLMSKRKLGYDFTKVNPIEGVRASNAPICFIHGKADTYIRPSHSEAMSQASSNPLTELHLFEGAEHACSHCTDKELYTKVVSAFIDKVESSLN